MVTFHGAEFGDVLFHEPHLLVNGFEFFVIGFDDILGIGFRPADQHRVGVFKRSALPGGGDAVFNLHQEHVAYDAQSLGCQTQSQHRIAQVGVPRVLDFLCGFLAHALTCPVP